LRDNNRGGCEPPTNGKDIDMDKRKSEIRIPFQGFYDSWLSDHIDHHLERDADYNGIEIDVLQDNLDYGATREAYIRAYAEAFFTWLESETDGALSLPDGWQVHPEMVSPQYYNFETDKIFARVPDELKKALYEYVMQNEAVLRDMITAQHQSRDGFASFYADDLDEWLEDCNGDITALDHNQMHTLLLAAIDIIYKRQKRDSDDFALDIYDYMCHFNMLDDCLVYSDGFDITPAQDSDGYRDMLTRAGQTDFFGG